MTLPAHVNAVHTTALSGMCKGMHSTHRYTHSATYQCDADRENSLSPAHPFVSSTPYVRRYVQNRRRML